MAVILVASSATSRDAGWTTASGAAAGVQTVVGAGFGGSTAETILDQGTYTVAANTLQVGSVIRITANGVVTAWAAGTLRIRLRINGTGGDSTIDTGAVAVGANDVYYLQTTIAIRTIGAPGSLIASGLSGLGTAPVALSAEDEPERPILTTADVTFDVTAEWSSNNVGNSVRNEFLLVEVLQP